MDSPPIDERAKPHITFNLPAQITQENASNLLTAFSKKIHSVLESPQTPHALCFDAHALEKFDSTALALLLAMRRQIHAAKRTFSIINLPERLKALARVYGVESLLTAA